MHAATRVVVMPSYGLAHVDARASLHAMMCRSGRGWQWAASAWYGGCLTVQQDTAAPRRRCSGCAASSSWRQLPVRPLRDRMFHAPPPETGVTECRFSCGRLTSSAGSVAYERINRLPDSVIMSTLLYMAAHCILPACLQHLPFARPI